MPECPRAKFSGLWIGIAINLAVAVILLAVIVAAALRENAAADARIRERVEGGIAELLAQGARIANDYGWWDEAYLRVELERDPEWAEHYIGAWLGSTADLNLAVALDAADGVLFSWPQALETASLLPVAEQVRTLPAAKPVAVTAFGIVGGRLTLLAGSALRPRDVPLGKPMNSVLILGWDFETQVLPHLRRNTGMSGLDLGAAPQSLALRDVMGREVARLHWPPVHPGTNFLSWVLPVVAGALAVLSCVAWRYWARARRHWWALVAADESKVRLLAAISHDLRQPLQSLSLFATVLEAEANSPRGCKAIDSLRASVERMAELLEAILSLARLDMRTGRHDRRPLLLDEVLAPLVREMGPQAEAKGLALRYVPSTARALSDPALLGTMVRNLIANSLRYTQHGGVLVGCRRRRATVEIWVCDSGIGIPPEKQRLIFEEFYQVGNAARDYKLGVGLGLAIVERLARVLEHRITIHSREGKGSRFGIELTACR